ncbi:MAG: glycosyltransferase family 4 protein [Flavobacteriales bacterium]|nr:glycosyltransferase family 4 protein [Flavobacteriales bacterium]
MVSMPTLHFFRWANQLENSGHEVFWFDVRGMDDFVDRISWVNQKVKWKLKWDYPGRHLIKDKLPRIYNFINHYNTRKTEEVFEQYLNEIKPDLVHSFALYVSCSPILSVMQRYPQQKWAYSSWGSDLYYFQDQESYLKDIKSVLPRMDYLITDCKRDHTISCQYGFKGVFLGVLPGGGGYHLDKMKPFIKPRKNKKTILVKGFQGRSGRSINVLKAVLQLKEELQGYKIVSFGSAPETVQFAKESGLSAWNNIQIFERIPQDQVLELMGESIIYIGNSNSDGMPNTLLEAICMDVFPIQSNPGGATAEIINHGQNGLLIEDCENVNEIKALLLRALGIIPDYPTRIEIRDSYDYELVRSNVLMAYSRTMK